MFHESIEAKKGVQIFLKLINSFHVQDWAQNDVNINFENDL